MSHPHLAEILLLINILSEQLQVCRITKVQRIPVPHPLVFLWFIVQT